MSKSRPPAEVLPAPPAETEPPAEIPRSAMVLHLRLASDGVRVACGSTRWTSSPVESATLVRAEVSCADCYDRMSRGAAPPPPEEESPALPMIGRALLDIAADAVRCRAVLMVVREDGTPAGVRCVHPVHMDPERDPDEPGGVGLCAGHQRHYGMR